VKDFVTIGATPAEESCQQSGTDHYNPVKARRECNIYARQLVRQFGEPPEGARIAVKSFPHDFGSYLEVVCYFDDAYPDSVDYAFRLEGESPENWDQESLEALAMAEVNP
jgi:hypothetical protein